MRCVAMVQVLAEDGSGRFEGGAAAMCRAAGDGYACVLPWDVCVIEEEYSSETVAQSSRRNSNMLVAASLL